MRIGLTLLLGQIAIVSLQRRRNLGKPTCMPNAHYLVFSANNRIA
jgi:hypothetical protein